MTVNLPTTVWSPYNQQGEYDTSDEELTNESGVSLSTESGVDLVTEETSFTRLASTTWSEDDST